MLLELARRADITFYIHFRPYWGLSCSEVLAMATRVSTDLDLIEELRLRRWARENYVPHSQREITWHPVVHDEMRRKDQESDGEEQSPAHYTWLKS
jgi:hypothetical protein